MFVDSMRHLGFIPRLSLILAICVMIACTHSLADELDDYVKAKLATTHFPGAAIAIIKNGMVVKSSGFGFANVEQGSHVTENTIFQLASLTKPLTANAIMLLVQDGKVNLDDVIGRHIDALPPNWNNVTVFQLLSHTSGIEDYTDTAGFPKSRDWLYTPRDLIDLASSKPLAFAPGERFAYSNTNYVLLGMVIERASGQFYGEFVKERIFEPADMANSGVNDLEKIMIERAQGYEFSGGELRNRPSTHPSQPFAAGMIVSSAADLAMWDLAIQSGKILSPANLELMYAQPKLKDGTLSEYALGWDVSHVNGHRIVSHGGTIRGFSTQLIRYPDDGLTVIVLLNALDLVTDANRMAQDIVAIVNPLLAKPTRMAIDDTNPELTQKLTVAVQGIVGGNVSQTHVDSKLIAVLKPVLQRNQSRHSLFGPLQRLDLLRSQENGDNIRLEYRAIFEATTTIVYLSVNKEMQLIEWGMGPDG